MTPRPYHDPEFIRTIQYVPFDAETEAEAQRQDEMRAASRFAMDRKRRDEFFIVRGILSALAFSLLMWAGIFAWCCL